MAQLKQWGLVLKLYTDDNDDHFFSGQGPDNGGWWMDPLRPYYRGNKNLLLCPDAVQPYTEGGRNPFGAWKVGDDSGSYGMNGWICNPEKEETELRGRGPSEDYWRTTRIRGANNIPLLLDAMWLDAWPRQTDEPPPSEDWLTDRVSETQMKANENEMRRFCVSRHQGYVNSLFMDWSVRRVGLKELWTLKWHRNYDTGGRWTRDGGCKRNDWPEWMRNFKDY
jgi:prepilin-type processing-associated H-X9-DG protein